MLKTEILGALSLTTVVQSTLANPRFSRPRGSASRIQKRDLINDTLLQESITIDALLEHAEALQGFAYATPERNRLIGGAGHNNTVKYVYDTLTSLDGYYNVSLQEFSQVIYNTGQHNLTVDGSVVEDASLFEYSPNGDVSDYLVLVDNLGCDASDFPAEVANHIALISRGTCEFGLKTALAGAAGASAAIIYNNVEGQISGTLGSPSRDEGPYVPVLSASLAEGSSWAEQIQAGANISASVIVANTSIEEKFTNNVIAQTVGGDANNVLHLGAHSDSVAAGPGINDNGSGSIALLELAKQLVKFDVNNAVRFSWWSAEEEGLVGSYFYVDSLPEEELAKIRLYLNFDMIASPNYVLAIYDGDGSAFNITGPPGSAEAEGLFQAYFESIGLNHTSSEFSGRSDYGPFLEVNIASGGLDTGAEGIKTEEEAAQFGGEAGIAYDPNYHGAGDTVDNLAQFALEVNTKAIAHALATYATSFDSLPANTASKKAKISVSSSQGGKWRGSQLIS